MYVDVHAHLIHPSFAGEEDATAERAAAAGGGAVEIVAGGAGASRPLQGDLIVGGSGAQRGGSQRRQGQGLGVQLMQALIDVARERGLKRMDGMVLAENRKMQKMMRKLGFSVRIDPDDTAMVLVSLAL